jgi:hypothetical protein
VLLLNVTHNAVLCKTYGFEFNETLVRVKMT